MSNENPLGHEKVGKLILKFAIPSIIGMLVGALYNIVDQIFIGRNVGYIGNAATNIDFPIAITALALALTFGIGAAANFSLALGSDDKERAAKIVGNSVFWLATVGLTLTIIFRAFLSPLLRLLGATDEVMPYALDYAGMTTLGLCFAMLSAGLSHIIRADGRPKLSMLSMLVGCGLNIMLDAVFILWLGMGMKGAGLATVISQFVAALLGLLFISRMRQVRLTFSCFKPSFRMTLDILKLGVAPFINHISAAVVQVLLNNSLRRYGAESVYGAEISLAVAGIVMKLNMLFFSVVIGISQGCQPIIGFNYGAKKYDRVRQTLKLGLVAATIMSVISFLCYQIIPRQLISLFGEGSELYFELAERFFRIYLVLAFINGVQPLCGNFFTSIGKAFKGVFIAMTRQFIFFMPLILTLPIFFGINGIIYSGPIADAAAMALALLLVGLELRKMKRFPE
jgi:putative MATE family efflux protein